MPSSKLTLKISIRWWVFYPYKFGLLFVAKLMRTEPDWDKVRDFVTKYCIKVSSKCD